MSCLSAQAPMAKWIRVPEVRSGRKSVADWRDTLQMRKLPVYNHRNCGDDFSGYPQAVDDVVSGHLACDLTEKRNERVRTAKSIGIRQLRNGVDVAS